MPSLPRTLAVVVTLLLAAVAPRSAQTDSRRHFRLDYWTTHVGSYQLASDRFLLIGLRWGGELSYLDTATGRFGPLAREAEDTFACPDGSRAVFVRDESEPTAVLWSEAGEGEHEAPSAGLRFEDIEVRSGGAVLAGTLVLPPDPGPYPLIIINGGASWIVREQVLDEALMYASYGVAACIYDKRGWGESTGEQTVPFSESADDIVAIVDYARYERTDIDPKEIGISTYSQSGWYGTLAASRTSAIAFLVLNVPPATFVYRQEFQRVEHELRADGFTEEAIAQALALMQRMSDFSRTGRGWEEYAAAREAAKDDAWFRYLFAPATRDPEAWRWGRMNWEYDPLPALESIRAPTLVILGETDKKVLPEVNRSIFEMAFDVATNRDATIRIVPKMNHDLVIAERGGRLEETPDQLAPGLVSMKLEWLLERVEAR